MERRFAPTGAVRLSVRGDGSCGEDVIRGEAGVRYAGSVSSAPGGEQLASALRRAQHAAHLRIDRALASLGLNEPRYTVLAALNANPAQTAADLSRRLFVIFQTMLNTVADLERAGLVRRWEHPDGGRALLAELTQPGRERFTAAHEAVQAIEADMVAVLGDTDPVQLAEVLLRVAGALGEQGDSGLETPSPAYRRRRSP